MDSIRDSKAPRLKFSAAADDEAAKEEARNKKLKTRDRCFFGASIKVWYSILYCIQ
jgi:hypothetical protein